MEELFEDLSSFAESDTAMEGLSLLDTVKKVKPSILIGQLLDISNNISTFIGRIVWLWRTLLSRCHQGHGGKCKDTGHTSIVRPTLLQGIVDQKIIYVDINFPFSERNAVQKMPRSSLMAAPSLQVDLPSLM
jgi:hypothetical protein